MPAFINKTTTKTLNVNIIDFLKNLVETEFVFR